MHRLITIRFSHYNEKARWALTRFAVPFRESGYMPLLHMPPVAIATWRNSDASADHVSTRYSTPVLITPDGRRICDSRRILAYVDERFAQGSLYPTVEAREFENHFHDRLGPHTRRVAYGFALDDAELIRDTARQNVGPLQAALFSALSPLGTRLMKRGLRITPADAEKSRGRVLEEVARVSDRIANRRYLVGDHFTAADLGFACMLAPALVVSPEEGYGAVLPPLSKLRSEAQEFAHQVRATPAGQFALRMFREEKRDN